MNEFELIARYLTRSGGHALVGIGDDAAVLDVLPGQKLVVALDTIVEGRHFPAGTAPEHIGYRALAVNLSDLAAMGATPAWMTLSLSLPAAEESWVSAFARGMFELADRFAVELVGGDTVRGPLVVSVQIAGWVEADRWLTRSGARPGDLLFVSGCTGEAAAGLAVLQRQVQSSAATEHLVSRFLRPEPRVALGRALRPFATAAMDVSDGLLTDLDKLCAASGCGAEVDVDALPASPAMRAIFDDERCVQYALAGGDDYEIIFTVSPQDIDRVRQLAQAHAVRHIGVMTGGSAVRCLRDGREYAVAYRGYDHFGADAAGGDGPA
jgi:thiamine-monophosphate kinase